MLHPDDLDHPDVPGSTAMGPGTSLDITGDLDDADIFARRHPSLVEGKAISLLSLRPFLMHDVHLLIGHDHPVGCHLDLPELFKGDMLVVPDIQPGTLDAFLGAGLVDVGPEHLLCGMKQEVGSGVMAHQRPAPLFIDDALDPVTSPENSSGYMVDDHVTDLLDIVHTDHALC